MKAGLQTYDGKKNEVNQIKEKRVYVRCNKKWFEMDKPKVM